MKIRTFSIVICFILLCGFVNSALASNETLVARLAEKQGITQSEAQSQLQSVFVALAEELEAGRDVTIRNFGKFYLQHRDAREGRNPKTGEKLDIPAKSYPRFRSSDTLKNNINKG
jgi:DNA-binding protein HU-beta